MEHFQKNNHLIRETRDEDGFMVFVQYHGLTADKATAFCKTCQGQGQSIHKKRAKARGIAKRECGHIGLCRNIYTGE